MLSLKKDDVQFQRAADAIEMISCLDFGIAASIFLERSLADATHGTFIIDPASEELIDFVLMSEMGFFSLTGERYQMTPPSQSRCKQSKTSAHQAS